MLSPESSGERHPENNSAKVTQDLPIGLLPSERMHHDYSVAFFGGLNIRTKAASTCPVFPSDPVSRLPALLTKKEKTLQR